MILEIFHYLWITLLPIIMVVLPIITFGTAYFGGCVLRDLLFYKRSKYEILVLAIVFFVSLVVLSIESWISFNILQAIKNGYQ